LGLGRPNIGGGANGHAKGKRVCKRNLSYELVHTQRAFKVLHSASGASGNKKKGRKTLYTLWRDVFKKQKKK